MNQIRERIGENVEHLDYQDLYAKRVVIEPGETFPQHMHVYEHFSVLAEGEVVVVIDGVANRLKGPAHLLVEAGKIHHVVAVTRATWYCIHSKEALKRAGW